MTVAVASALLLLEDAGCKTSTATTPPTGSNLRPVIAIFSQDTSTITSSGLIDPEVKAELEAYDYVFCDPTSTDCEHGTKAAARHLDPSGAKARR